MIGGTDIVTPPIGDAAALDACVRAIQRYWPQATFEHAVTGEKYGRYSDLPRGRTHEPFVYADAAAEAAWDTDKTDRPLNSMIYLILSPDSVTAVVDDPKTKEMRTMLKAIRNGLKPTGRKKSATPLT
jgi:hypothetical protein